MPILRLTNETKAALAATKPAPKKKRVKTGGRQKGTGRRVVHVPPFEKMPASKVPPDLREQWTHFLKETACSAKTIRSIYRVLAYHQTWRAAAESEGANPEGVWSTACQWRLTGRGRARLGERLDRLVGMGQDLLEEKLVATELDDLSIRDLTSVVQTAGGQLAKVWEREEAGAAYASVLDKIADRLGAGGGKVTLELTLTPADPAQQAIDVTPVSG
jgi:hypothetical protein